MEGRDIYVREIVTTQALADLLNSFLVVGEYQDLVWLNVLVTYKMDYFTDDGGGLACPGSGEDQGHVLIRSDGLGLLVRDGYWKSLVCGGPHDRNAATHETVVRPEPRRLESVNGSKWFEAAKDSNRFGLKTLTDKATAPSDCANEVIVYLERHRVPDIALPSE